ncbi:ATP-dependent DNA ligase [Alkaliphilus peptidifermentans]|uniref:DNA ligase-1 n=1 Tax=Alkaliphilus peptidifermentans DSM 18978 TaxID=1120976 RepID=A0A1G5LB76_9FIRM|nr:hypothetical protein [Alkaliphilus peptidifermentans]SCZ10155.1 DNA ligase-1 [Alkaliphilus peptidifermentans DSM 18978]
MFLPPMLLETAPNPFSSPDYIYEIKYDGIRIELSNIDIPILYTRNGNNISKNFPELLQSPLDDIVLDGEVVCLNSNGKESFDSVIKRFSMKKEEKIKQHSKQHPAMYFVFDILYYKGQDLRQKDLTERKRLLANTLENSEFIKKVNYIDEKGEKLFQEIIHRKHEGMIAKRKDSSYVGKRTSSWLKIINWIEVNAVISAFRKKDNALVCLDDMGNMLGYVIHGMNPHQKQAFFAIATKLKIKEDNNFVYLKPLIRCILKGRGITEKGSIRSAIFVDFIL